MSALIAILLALLGYHPPQEVEPGTVLSPLPACTTTLDGCRIPPCPNDESPEVPGTACYWDAQHMGNGQGTSFWLDSNGNAHPYPG